MKRVKAECPYSDYWLYKIFHRKEGRWQANLILISDTKVRTTLSYARYLMSVKCGRILEKDEHVDHIDNDKSNDSIDNLQILSPDENKKKQEEFYALHNQKYTVLNCVNCEKEFKILSRNFRFHTKNGRKNFNCSRKCAHDSLRNKRESC